MVRDWDTKKIASVFGGEEVNVTQEWEDFQRTKNEMGMKAFVTAVAKEKVAFSDDLCLVVGISSQITS